MEDNKKDMKENEVAEQEEATDTPAEIEMDPDKKSQKFAQDLKEHYEEVMEDNAKAIEKSKKKQAKKKKRTALIVIGSVLLAIILGVTLFFVIGGALHKDPKLANVTLSSARPTGESTFAVAEQTAINTALSEGATDDQIKEAIALIYQRANTNKIQAKQCLMLGRGEGSAAVKLGILSAEGTMITRAFKAQSETGYYYQKAAKLIKCTAKALTDAIAGTLNQQERAYVSGAGDFKTVLLKGEDANIIGDDMETFPFLKVGAPAKENIVSCDDHEEFMEAAYYLDSEREISNFRITKDTIVLKELEEGQSYIEYNEEEQFYTLRFSLLIEGEGHDECVEVSRQYLRDSADSADLEYGQYDVIFEVWDNGYAKSFYDDEQWKGSFELIGKKCTTTSTASYKCTFYYSFDESLFSEADAEKYKGDSWSQAIINDYCEPLK